jgi:hypothetical protein
LFSKSCDSEQKTKSKLTGLNRLNKSRGSSQDSVAILQKKSKSKVRY